VVRNGNATNKKGTIRGKSWSGVTIDWDDGESTSLSHHDMAHVDRAQANLAQSRERNDDSHAHISPFHREFMVVALQVVSPAHRTRKRHSPGSISANRFRPLLVTGIP
jgi:hypothetical protein